MGSQAKNRGFKPRLVPVFFQIHHEVKEKCLCNLRRYSMVCQISIGTAWEPRLALILRGALRPTVGCVLAGMDFRYIISNVGTKRKLNSSYNFLILRVPIVQNTNYQISILLLELELRSLRYD